MEKWEWEGGNIEVQSKGERVESWNRRVGGVGEKGMGKGREEGSGSWEGCKGVEVRGKGA